MLHVDSCTTCHQQICKMTVELQPQPTLLGAQGHLEYESPIGPSQGPPEVRCRGSSCETRWPRDLNRLMAAAILSMSFISLSATNLLLLLLAVVSWPAAAAVAASPRLPCVDVPRCLTPKPAICRPDCAGRAADSPVLQTGDHKPCPG